MLKMFGLTFNIGLNCMIIMAVLKHHPISTFSLTSYNFLQSIILIYFYLMLFYSISKCVWYSVFLIIIFILFFVEGGVL